MRVLKFPFPDSSGEMTIDLPAGSQALHVHEQNGKACLWVIIPDEDAPKEQRRFAFFGTGHHIDTPLSRGYIGTFHVDGFVFHTFEMMPRGKS